MYHIEVRNRMANIFVANNFDVRSEHGVSIGVIVMKVRVHHPAHRFVRDQFHILQQRPGGCRGGSVINQNHIAFVDNDWMISAGGHRTIGSGVIHAVRDFLELVNLARDC